jgi:hypothetical protein
MFKHIIHNANKYGTGVSSQDWLKFVAVVIMTIDHIGAYFLTGEAYTWFKVIGRFTFPVWFFFAGYSQSKQLSGEIIWYGLFLILVNLVGGRGIFPMNALISIFICRVCVRLLRERDLSDKHMWDVFLVCAFLSLFSQTLFEYGSLGILYAIMGDMVRRGKTEKRNQSFFFAIFVLFMFYQYIGLQPNALQAIIMTLGVGYYSWRLAHFEMRALPWFEAHQTFGYVVRLFGRNTLYYYAIHRSIFVLASYYGGFYVVNQYKLLGLFGW